MLVAYFLGLDGDSFTVMQAVLDTQFWLATHVICVTVGYSATFWAGAFGLAYIGYRNPVLFCLTLLAGLLAGVSVPGKRADLLAGGRPGRAQRPRLRAEHGWSDRTTRRPSSG